jgi:plasmid stabilization system protein ParE
VPEFGNEALREVIAGNYRVIYRLRDGDVQVIRIRHGARLLRESDVQED